MADKSKNLSAQNGQKVISMKLFATLEIEKSSPNCIPRICSLRITRLVVMKPLEHERSAVIIAMKMQSSKRILRSLEIELPSGGGGGTEVQLDLSFMLQYPHFLKRDGNKLQVMLQRRKRYKNRPMIGYKTLAVGQLSMAEVLQHTETKEMCLYADIKDHKNVVARLMMVNLSSSPVDHEENTNGRRKLASSDVDRSPDVDVDSDDDENEEDQENWSNDELSDSEPTMLDEGHSRQRSVNRSKVRPAMHGQRNFKQKFVALLRKFKLSEEVLESDADHEMLGDPGNPGDIDDLIHELEDLSDSDQEPEMDNISVRSTPKPRLRPFFTGRGSTNDIDRQSLTDYSFRAAQQSDDSSNSQAEKDTDVETSDATTMVTSMEAPTIAEPAKPEKGHGKSPVPSGPSPSPSTLQKPQIKRERSTSYKERKDPSLMDQARARRLDRCNSMGWVDNSPRKALLDQLTHVLGGSDDRLPENLFLVNTVEWQGQLLVQKLQEMQLRVICTCSDADVKATLNFLVTKIQRFCNYNSKNPNPIKVGISGGDNYINSVLRPYVEQFSAKSPDWQNYLRFLVIPLGYSAVGKYLSHIDGTYNSLFMDSAWRDTFDRTESTKLESQDILNRVSKYMSSAGSLSQIPIAEAMIMCKGKGSDEESTQMFVPFLCEIKIGCSEVINATSIDLDEASSSMAMPALSSSPPQQTPTGSTEKQMHTPPNSPNVGGAAPSLSQTPTAPSTSSASSAPNSATTVTPLSLRDYMELQVDYWTLARQPDPASDRERDKDRYSSKKESSKSSMKTGFKSLHVSRVLLHNVGPTVGAAALSGGYGPVSAQLENPSVPFSMSVVTREKKQKIRIGKKSKEAESKSQVIEGISRLICTSKSQSQSLKVAVDGVDWPGVKFFQLSSQWQTHIKHFPVAVFTPDSTSLNT